MRYDERFHPIVEGTSAAIFVFDARRILYINPACRRLTGRSARELLGRPFPALLHPSFRSRYERINEQAKGSRREQVQILRKGGRELWIDLSLCPILFRGSAATLATAVEIDQLKLSDLARREAEVQLKLVQRAGRTVSWDWRVATDELVVFGLPKDLVSHGAPSLSTTGTAFFEQLQPNDLSTLKQALRHSIQDREPLFLEVRLADLQGGSRWVVLRAQAVADRDGRVEHVVGVATDVTERRRAEEALVREQESTLQVLVSISDGVIRTDLDGRVEHLSQPAESMLGESTENLRGRLLSEVFGLFETQTRTPLPDPVADCLETPEPVSPPRDCLLRRPGGEDLPIRYHTVVLRSEAGHREGVVMVIRNLVERRHVERSMVYLATHDPLTNMVNRPEFERRLVQVIASAERKRRQDTLLYLDLDGFKLVNDTLGHPAGDRMLRQFASFLKCRFRETDTLGRLGGDKFGILLESCPAWQARELVEKLYKELRTFRFEWDETSLPVSLSTGLYALGSETQSSERALAAAESACYLAKQKGGGCIAEYEPAAVSETDRHSQRELLQLIQEALRNGAFELYGQLIQPLRDIDANQPLCEILVRLRQADDTLLSPAAFVPVAERHHLVSAIDRLVLTRTLEAIAEHSSPAVDEPMSFTVNISGQSVADDRFLEFALHELSYRGMGASQIFFEITETATVANLERAQRFISVMKSRGCGFILDDFGTGLSSFAYLRNFPVDFIKIDGEFVSGISRDPTRRALVESINNVGHVMQIKTIAECVEDEGALETLREMRVDYVQGNAVAEAVPLALLLSTAAA